MMRRVAIACFLVAAVVAAASVWACPPAGGERRGPQYQLHGSIETIDGGGTTGAGDYNSLALDWDGGAHIAYHSEDANGLMYAYRAPGGGWATEIVESGNGEGQYCDIAVDSDAGVRISYSDDNGAIKVASKPDGGAWSFHTFVASGASGHTAIAIDGMNGTFACFEESDKITCAYMPYGGIWAAETVFFEASQTYGWLSLSCDVADGAHLAYTKDNGRLCHGYKPAGGNWSNEVVDDSGYVGAGCSVSVDTSNGTHIGYFDYQSMEAKYAYRPQNGTWSLRTVGPTSASMYYISVATDDWDSAHITFDSTDASTLEYALVNSTSAPQRCTLDAAPCVYWSQSSIAITQSGEAWISYYSENDTALNFFEQGVSSPSAPQNLVASVSDYNVTLTWSAPADDGGAPVANYRIFSGTDSGSLSPLAQVGNVLTYTDSGLAPGTYYYIVAAQNSAGYGPNSTEAVASVTGAPVMTVPGAPRNLNAVASGGAIVLTWEAPSSDGGTPITNYNISRGTSSDGETYLATISNVTTYSDTGLAIGTFYYKVAAMNSIGTGPDSNETFAMWTGDQAPSAPTNFVATGWIQQVNLSWNAPVSSGSSPITNYEIYRGNSSGAETFLCEVANTTFQYFDAPLNMGTYFYQISAKNSVGEGPMSFEVNCTAFINDGPFPPILFPATVTGNVVDLTWTTPVGPLDITNYNIYRGTASNAETLLINIGNVNYYRDQIAISGTYYYRVSALYNTSEGPLSNEINVTVTLPPAAPSIRGFVNDTSGQPIPGVLVNLRNGTFQRNATTDAAGKYEFLNLTAGPYTLTFSKTGFVTQTRQVNITTSGAAALDISLAAQAVTPPPDDNPAQGTQALYILALIAIIIAIVLIFVVLSRRKKAPAPAPAEPQSTTIDEVFLIYRDGRLIRHETRRIKPDMDNDILSSMIIAVQNFVKDSFRGERGDLDHMKFGELDIQLCHGQYIVLAVIIKGEDREGVRNQLKAFVQDVESRYSYYLKDWNGDMDAVQPVGAALDDLIKGKYKAQNPAAQ